MACRERRFGVFRDAFCRLNCRKGKEIICDIIITGIFAAEGFFLAYWAGLLTIVKSQTQSQLLEILSSAPHLLLFGIFALLTLNWVLALPVLIGKENFQQRTETILRIVVLVVAGLLVLALSILNSVAFVLRHDDSSVRSAADILEATMRVLTVTMVKKRERKKKMLSCV